jgi:hypothetical protein
MKLFKIYFINISFLFFYSMANPPLLGSSKDSEKENDSINNILFLTIMLTGNSSEGTNCLLKLLFNRPLSFSEREFLKSCNCDISSLKEDAVRAFMSLSHQERLDLFRLFLQSKL